MAVKHIVKRLYELTKNIYLNRVNKCLVLIYHRVTNLETDPQLLAVTPHKFEEQIRYLKEHYNIISLQELVAHLRTGTIPKRSVVITFDDGYADNLYYAKPILEKYNVPATVFVTADMVGSEREYWWDELERLFLMERDISRNEELQLKINGKTYFWDCKTRDSNEKAYKQLHQLLKYLKHEERSIIIDELFSWAGIPRRGRDTHRAMNVDELVSLSDGGLIEIGAHTMTHCVLACETEERQAWEIFESKKKLEEMLGFEIKSFSYPFGTNEDFTNTSSCLVQNAGFNCGIANEPGLTDNTSNLYFIPRQLIRNWDINDFQKKLDDFTGINNPDLIDLVTERFVGSYISRKVYYKRLLPRIRAHSYYVKNKKTLNSVLQVNMIDTVGGAAKVAYRLHKSWEKREYDSKMIVSKAFSDSSRVKVLLKDNSKFQRILNRYQEQWSWQDLFCMESFNIIEDDFFTHSDIVHLHNLHHNYFSIFALPEICARKPVIWTLHDMHAITGHCAHSLTCNRWQSGCNNCPDLLVYPAIKNDSSNFLWNIKKEIYNNSSFTIVCPSLWLKNKVAQSILKNHDCRLIYNGVDQSIYKKYNRDYARKVLQLPADKKILLFCADGGAANSWKGGQYIDLLYAALNRQEDVLFLNVGGSESGCRNHNWLDVSYVNDESTMAMYYSAADVFIYPSIADNCPLVVLESLACGTPVIAFDTGGIPELVEHLKNGYIAEYKNSDDFIRGVKLFLFNTEIQNDAGNEAIRAVTNKFSLDLMIDAYEKLYNEVLTNPK